MSWTYSGAAPAQTPWEWRSGGSGRAALCDWRPLERNGGRLWCGSGGVQPSIQLLEGGVFPSQAMVLQWLLFDLPRHVPVAWALSWRDIMGCRDMKPFSYTVSSTRISLAQLYWLGLEFSFRYQKWIFLFFIFKVQKMSCSRKMHLQRNKVENCIFLAFFLFCRL